MIITASSIRDELAAVKSEILVPVDLADDVLEVLATARNTGKADENFLYQFPLIVAHVKPEIQAEMLAEAKGNTPAEPSLKFNTAYGQDTRIVHKALWGNEACMMTQSETGLFAEPRTAFLHSDINAGFFYTTRVVALPLEYIKTVRLARTTRGEKQIIIDAKNGHAVRAQRRHISAYRGFRQKPVQKNTSEIFAKMNEHGEKARQELRDMGILVPAPLGAVMLLPGGKRGVLHCSSLIPKGGAYSGFFRSFSSTSLVLG